jgi:hypothetical protein
MKIKTWFIAGVIGIAAVAGVFEALNAPRRKEETGEKKKEPESKSA